MTDEKQQELTEIGKSAMSSIRELVANLDREHAATEWAVNLTHKQCLEILGVDETDEDIAELHDAVIEQITEGDEPDGFDWSEDDARDAILEDALCVQVRAGWRELGAKDDNEAEEFEILLTTGGPAVRIRGELSDGQPKRAWLEVQDWGTPWTEHIEPDSQDVLLEYARQFCFEE